jgi:hypothetical protein
MSISENLAHALSDLPVEPLELEVSGDLTLESMMSGNQHAMTEIGASFCAAASCCFPCVCCCCCTS